jgi:hypothetical protein
VAPLRLARIPASEPASLAAGATIERVLRGGETHSYRLTLKEKEFVRIQVKQHGIDVVVSVTTAADRQLAETDRPNGATGPESLSVISEAGGMFTLHIRALDEHAKPGKYIVSYDQRLPTEPDRKRIAAEYAYAEAGKLESDRETLSKARELAEFAFKTWSQKDKARALYERANEISRKERHAYIFAYSSYQLMDHWQEAQQPQLSIFYGKQIINSLQEIRGNILSLDSESIAS